MKRFAVVLFSILMLSGVFAVIEEHEMSVYAVTTSDETALIAGLSVQIKQGTGKVWSSVEPLIGTSTQTTEKISVEVARNYSNKVDLYDYFFDINSTASLVDGPSAGAAMALLVISMLQDRPLPENVSITGTITVDGGIGAVGGVFKKAQKAAATGIDLFMVPQGEARQIVKLPSGVESIDLSDYAKKEWGITVVEVANIDDSLKFAFSDIGSIDVNKENGFTPDFVPGPIIFPDNLGAMASLTTEYIARAEVNLGAARNALSGTLLTDPSMVDAMLSILNQSEKTLERAKLLRDQNYLYSSANFAFLAIVNASLVTDISDDPSLLEQGSTVWQLKLLNLRKDIEALKHDLNRFIPLDYLEWHVAAKERLTWAEEKLLVLEAESETMVITVGGTQANEQVLENLFDFEYAVAWFEAAKSFHAIGASSVKKVSGNGHFGQTVEAYLVNVENALSVLTEDEKEDVLRRFNAAKIARNEGWIVSALFDSASALALANASIYVKNKGLDEVDSYLKSKIAEVEAEMSASPHNFVWAKLYLDHAVYYSKATDFYRSHGENIKALDTAKSGIALAFLSENMLSVSIEAYDYFGSVPAESYLPVEGQSELQLEGIAYMLPLLALLIIVVIALFVLILKLSKKIKELRVGSINSQIVELRLLQEQLDEKWKQKKLDGQKYGELSREYNRCLSDLLGKKSRISHLIVDLDMQKAMLFAFEHGLQELRKRNKKGLVIREDYLKGFNYYKTQIALLKESIDEKHGLIFAKKPLPQKPKKHVSGKKKAGSALKKTAGKKKPVPKQARS